ncbi:hypothetical protein AAMO2058_001406200 [Amorphochlora amoebiformis]
MSLGPPLRLSRHSRSTSLALPLGTALFVSGLIFFAQDRVPKVYQEDAQNPKMLRTGYILRQPRSLSKWASVRGGNWLSSPLVSPEKMMGAGARPLSRAATMVEEETKKDEASSNFIRAIIDDDLASGKTGGKVVTRFPPEPNGYLHIGHAKSICLNFGLAEDYKGTCHLRFDDTNPLTEDTEYVESIINDVRWLGFEPHPKIFYASDYFDKLYEHAKTLIKNGDAYVDTCTEEEIRELRGTVKTPGSPSPHRERPVEENLQLFEKMRTGDFKDGEAVLRAKIDMKSANMLLRDPLLYRIKHQPPHHRTENKWPIYPMYDFAHPLSDAIEGITHSICTLEFDVHRPLYDWLVDKLYGSPRPYQYEMGRLNLDHTITSKRKLLKLVEEGFVTGWDDPRMPTIAGIRRRGIPPEAIRRFCKMVGVARAESRVEAAMLDAAIRDELNEKTPRVMAVLNPLKVTLTNWDEDRVEMLSAPLFPDTLDTKEGKGESRDIPLTREIYIEKDDFMLDPPKKYFRLKPGGEVRLRYGYIIKCEEVITSPDTGEVIELKCSLDFDTKSGTKQSRKVKGTIHWVSASHGVPADVRLLEPLLTVPNADEAVANDPSKSLNDFLNKKSLVSRDGAVLEPYLGSDIKKYMEGDGKEGHLPRYQLERQGFFALDRPDPITSGVTSETEKAEKLEKSDKIILNRIVALRDTWAKIDAKNSGKQAEGG